MTNSLLHHSYRMPAEYEPHDATWILWPTRPDNWRDQAKHAQKDILALITAISEHEMVKLGVNNPDVPKVKRLVPKGVEVVDLDFDDIWVRDTGPNILTSPTKPPIAIDWRFNSWGGLFDSSSADNRVASQIAKHENLTTIPAPMVLEGGSLLCDGMGTLIATEESILNENRNPGLTKATAEILFKQYLNIHQVIWIPNGLEHDEAGGHIDNVCMFVSKGKMLVADDEDMTSKNYVRLQQAQKILKNSKDLAGNSYSISLVTLPKKTSITSSEAVGFAETDGTIERSEGTPLAPSYINSYVGNNAVFVPVFGVESDDFALKVYKEAFPKKIIVPIQSREFLLGGGTVHCITKEIYIDKVES